MIWEVEYVDRTLSSRDVSWRDLPATGVLRARFTHRQWTQGLQGVECYWYDGEAFGVAIPPEAADQYGGERYARYEPSDRGFRRTEAPPPDGVHLLWGVMIPDDDARARGLL